MYSDLHILDAIPDCHEELRDCLSDHPLDLKMIPCCGIALRAMQEPAPRINLDLTAQLQALHDAQNQLQQTQPHAWPGTTPYDTSAWEYSTYTPVLLGMFFETLQEYNDRVRQILLDLLDVAVRRAVHEYVRETFRIGLLRIGPATAGTVPLNALAFLERVRTQAIDSVQEVLLSAPPLPDVNPFGNVFLVAWKRREDYIASMSRFYTRVLVSESTTIYNKVHPRTTTRRSATVSMTATEREPLDVELLDRCALLLKEDLVTAAHRFVGEEVKMRCRRIWNEFGTAWTPGPFEATSPRLIFVNVSEFIVTTMERAAAVLYHCDFTGGKAAMHSTELLEASGYEELHSGTGRALVATFPIMRPRPMPMPSASVVTSAAAAAAAAGRWRNGDIDEENALEMVQYTASGIRVIHYDPTSSTALNIVVTPHRASADEAKAVDDAKTEEPTKKIKIKIKKRNTWTEPLKLEKRRMYNRTWRLKRKMTMMKMEEEVNMTQKEKEKEKDEQRTDDERGEGGGDGNKDDNDDKDEDRAKRLKMEDGIRAE